MLPATCPPNMTKTIDNQKRPSLHSLITLLKRAADEVTKTCHESLCKLNEESKVGFLSCSRIQRKNSHKQKHKFNHKYNHTHTSPPHWPTKVKKHKYDLKIVVSTNAARTIHIHRQSHMVCPPMRFVGSSLIFCEK